ncbi:hypothetical protein [Lyticum sinuosum]|uniref:NADPH-dependent 7-cyano-7-deazaguanine reductase n=1 Tax=Lyticum sinuosum TaxID=1332059 RepID=A0AAE4VMF8_9RICK|nr:hypothetical protein [Lyticum sinuosum]MDZ5761593.1 NADPH-dependent 7-cyano-7-deazaguanine reductase [Lyticum sinuosum]
MHNLSLSPLGKNTPYISYYSSELLCFIPRLTGRKDIYIHFDQNDYDFNKNISRFNNKLFLEKNLNLSMYGFDLWNAYEISWLDTNSIPIIAIGEIMYSSSSPSIVESKSLKLYLNSFSETIFESTESVEKIIANDLTKGIGTPVFVKLYESTSWNDNIPIFTMVNDDVAAKKDGFMSIDNALRKYCKRSTALSPKEILKKDHLDIFINKFKLKNSIKKNTYYRCYSKLLRSLCPVTGQPDWGTVYIVYSGDKIRLSILARYILGTRNLNMFHEQSVEKIFTDIWRMFRPKFLKVWARYNRRGGIDINPHRIGFVTNPSNDKSIRGFNKIYDEKAQEKHYIEYIDKKSYSADLLNYNNINNINDPSKKISKIKIKDVDLHDHLTIDFFNEDLKVSDDVEHLIKLFPINNRNLRQ